MADSAHIEDRPAPHLPAGVEAPAGLIDAFWEYETALMGDDLVALDRLFAPGEDTLRGDAGGLLIGHDAISGFRKGRGGSPQRAILRVEVRPVGHDAALIVAVTAPLTGGRGQQTQLWRAQTSIDGAREWKVEAAHVHLPAPAIPPSTWRVVGSPLVTGAGEGPLMGQRVAVKDLFAVARYAVGGGVPAFLDGAEPATSHAPAVAALLNAGADVQGIAQTDEFAYSIAGRNPHYGTPPNPAVPGAISGGSSSGPASAVAMGQATIGLGTDTGGSIRVPASYQGLWGLRTTHDAVSVGGVLPLAPSFDTVGWMTRDAATLRLAATASLPPARQKSAERRFAVAPALTALLTDEVRTSFAAAIAELSAAGLVDDLVEVDLGDIDKLFETYRVVQASEAWGVHGDWITAHPGSLGDDVAARFRIAAEISGETTALARSAAMVAEARIGAELDDRILLLPSATSAAPSATADSAEIETVRAGTMRLTCIAGISRKPALSVPVMTVATATTDTAPVGLCLVGPRFTDLSLIQIGEDFAAALA
ncbi:AtzH-like domain-containing protein [Glaciihabitans sp. dw_435]|uniref:AtzH-like domain-containing protein n=1 Tax=Glaciihabitans sp. dw_435 TaxID=2720081 RepID=UPI0027DDB2A0|nr:AtzH-like domain-containing protein [Glaciihabitans sp. dw_435]